MGASRKLEQSLRNEFFNHLQSLDFDFFDKRKIGDLMAHTVNDIETLPEDKIKQWKDEALEKYLLSLDNASDLSCTVSRVFNFAELLAIQHLMYQLNREKLLKLAHIRQWPHSEKWNQICPVCVAEEEISIKPTTLN